MELKTMDGISIQQITLLLTISACVAAIVKRVNIPYTVALVLVGLCLSFFHLLKPIHLTEELVLFIFLPALLFEAAWNLNIHYLKETWKNISLFATIGVGLSIAIIGFSVHYVLGLPLMVGLLFGAVIAPTDPVSVVAIMKQLHLDHRLAALVEGESLLNDGTSVVVFKLLFAILINAGFVITQEQTVEYIGGGLLQFIGVVGGGAAIGALFGYSFSKITRWFNDHLLELMFTTLVAYGAFLTAELITVPGIVQHMHFSGVIATVTAGLVMGNYGRQIGMSASTQIVISSFWEYAGFVMNSLLFLLVGLEIQLPQIIHNWWSIMLAIFIVILARVISVYGLAGLSRICNIGHIPIKWQHILVAGGLRGALSMALILSIPREVLGSEIRDLLVVMVFGVVLFTLVVQGVSMSPLLTWLKLGHQMNEKEMIYLKARAEMSAAHSAVQQVEEWQNQGIVAPFVAKSLQKKLNEDIQNYKEVIEDIQITDQELIKADIETAEKQLIVLKKSKIAAMVGDGFITEAIGQELRVAYDQELLK